MRTDFVGLAQEIKVFENFYTVGQHLSKILEIIGADTASIDLLRKLALPGAMPA